MCFVIFVSEFLSYVLFLYFLCFFCALFFCVVFIFVVLCCFCFIVCTSVGLLPPAENPIAVSSSSSSSNLLFIVI